MSLVEIKDALRDIPGIEGLTMSYALNGNQIFTLADVSVEVSPAASNDEIRSALIQPAVPTKNTRVVIESKARMAPTPIDRLKDKFLQARGVAQRVASTMEAEADALIKEEQAMQSATAEAFAPHKAILGDAKNELQQIKDALNLMSNGGPPLDGAENTGHG